MRFAILLFGIAAQAQQLTYLNIASETLEARLKLADTDNRKRKEALWTLFEEAGCRNNSLAEQPVSKKGLPNIICTMRGETEATIIVGAHFDALNLGVADNWSGAVMLAALYQSLSRHPRKHTFLFIGFTDEEKGLIGSRHYVKQMTKAEVARTRAMVNMDTLGLAPTNVWVSKSDKTLIRSLQTVAGTLKLTLSGVNIERVGSTDSEAFARTKIPRISISSVTQETLPILHSPKDTFDAIKSSDYYDTYRLLTMYLAYLDVKLASALDEKLTNQ